MDLGHAEPVIASTLNHSSDTYYMPIHGVVKTSSTSTILRVVFDTSAKSSTNVSLNDTLLNVPIYPSINTILLKFRMYPVTISSDISKMYHVWR